ncbi:hypothetical protein [Tropicibacter naphthalenivorans]|uniref:Uncharacterized protein n=1 Tax=Tropicibacter naphthalenivorans TaxID=441103 RepID=A0A0P1H232_9RHOB|nr:hypothetical protein [Tropicibacter naphthalenivorans]CUH82410.1 hypothetical protein TRN7648_03950 [Tropicibacter naphthalenivorans]SMD06426.1 hypothetical protein SAMN04488093_11452 [Tropicibacter naphthalenivorans]
MTIEAAEDLFSRALEEVIGQVNRGDLGEANEATVQHHLALSLHLLAREEGLPFSIIMERRIQRTNGGVFPKKGSNNAEIDVFFTVGEDETRCAVELKLFKRSNHREPNNRYDSYADLANLEIYLEEHCDIGFFVLLTDHPHYFDPAFGDHRPGTADFSLREGHVYQAQRELSYRTNTPYGTPLTLRQDYSFHWQNDGNDWRFLILKVSP